MYKTINKLRKLKFPVCLVTLSDECIAQYQVSTYLTLICTVHQCKQDKVKFIDLKNIMYDQINRMWMKTK